MTTAPYLEGAHPVRRLNAAASALAVMNPGRRVVVREVPRESETTQRSVSASMIMLRKTLERQGYVTQVETKTRDGVVYGYVTVFNAEE